MSNSIELAEKFLPVLDEVYKVAALTSRMDSQTVPDFSGAHTVKIFKTSMVGLGNYSKANGYPDGDVTGIWEDLALSKDRGRKFQIDSIDNEESMNMAFGTLVGEFLRTQVVPEVDAYRFSQYAQGAGHAATPATLAANTVLAAFDAAQLVLDEAEVPREGRILFASSTVAGFIRAAVSRVLGNENTVNRLVNDLDNVAIIPVPQSRFYTQITLDAGSSASAGGYAKTSVYGKDINFILMHPSAAIQAVKHVLPKIFDPATNQSADAWLFEYRLYHDALVYENKEDGIYLHNKA